jgi:nitrogen fixation/metabolism regulation signal transduction histidine kinase
MRLSNLQLKSKLILVFALVCLIPTVSLVLVSHFIIAQSIDRWERVSAELRKLLVLPTADDAMRIASDISLIQALENQTDLSGVDLELSENYILVIFDATGKQIFGTIDDSIPEMNLGSLADAGLPPIDEFRPWEPITPGEIRVKDKELALSAVMCQSTEDGGPLGVVAVAKLMPSAPTDIGSETIIALLIFAAVSVFLIALWISSLIAREITNPIKELAAGTREVAAGDLDYQVNIDARDEVGMLADSFNQMTMRLRRYADELRVAEKSAAWREVAQKLAHEIKNPLTPIQLSAERLRRRYHSRREGYEQVLDECTSTIVDEVDKLRRLLDEFSRLARMPRADPVPSDINTILAKSLRLCGEFPENVEVITEYAEHLPPLSVDPEQMGQAFFNIIKNAVEAMSRGGRLTLHTREVDSDSKCVEIGFADTGPGISEDAMARLFTPHFSTKIGGAGLGLAIVQKIVTDHGGEVTVKSEEGKGTIFTIRIPILEGAGNNG